MSSAVLAVAAFFAAIVALLACSVAKAHMLTAARYREACALIAQELRAHPEAQAAAEFIRASGEDESACTVPELQAALTAGRTRWLIGCNRRSSAQPKPAVDSKPARRHGDRQIGHAQFPFVVNLALVAAFVAVAFGAQLLDGPSPMQAEQDVQDEVLAAQSNPPAPDMRWVQAESSAEPR